MRLSVIVPCARPWRVASCIQALLSQKDSEGVELLVVGDVEPIPRISDPRLTSIPCPTLHPNVRRNLGISRAKGELIAFLDDDASPEPGWLTAALRVDPNANRILTGPELPSGASEWSRIFHAATTSVVAQGTLVQVNFRPSRVKWYEVPFCNCVVPKKVFEKEGPLSEEIPWDMDDFHFFFPLRNAFEFQNDPKLLIRHDRYPDSPRAFLAQKCRERIRTGEKTVLHPKIYLRIPPVAAAVAAPFLGAIGIIALGPWAAALVVFLYAAAAAFALPRGLWEAVRRTGVLVSLHAVTLAGLQWGLVRGLLYRAGIIPSRFVAEPLPR